MHLAYFVCVADPESGDARACPGQGVLDGVGCLHAL
jgi:hypothetical protein